MNPGVSIAASIPCYNGERTLRRAIEGVRAQSVPLKELLVVDDGSTDGSREIAWGSADRVVQLPRNAGRGAARNRAIHELSADYILFCDSGMCLEPRFVSCALEYFADEKVAAVFGVPTDPEAGSLAERWRERHLFKAGRKNRLESHASLATGGVLLKRAAVMAVGNFDARLRAGEDEELGRRLLAAGYDVICDPALRLKPLEHITVRQVLARYARWNCAPAHVPGWREYWRLVGYARAMAREDLADEDFPAALLTLLAPHYLFWSRRCGGFQGLLAPRLNSASRRVPAT